MAAQKLDKKRRKKRKARTDVSSSSSSSDSDSPPQSPIHEPVKAVADGDAPMTSPPRQSVTQPDPSSQPQAQQTRNPEQAFEEFYLKQATKEFSDDLDKLRSAPDFKITSVPILIEALRQGTATFATEEKRKFGASGGEGR